MGSERYIERSFPIVQLNPLSVRERNAFKPVYKMHKWFARRSSSIFRAILLGAALPEEQDGKPIDLMEEFYRGHGDDQRLRRPDGTPLRVLDPFMGGGTTVVEALRLGFDVTGIDYNPIAWFIVRGETTPVDLKALDKAYKRVAAKVRDELLAMYKTTCPLTGEDADIIYGFWVKQGICVDPGCAAVTDLFKDYIVGRIQGDLGVYYFADVVCPDCGGVFDWELERCTITAGGDQLFGEGAAGKSRPKSTAFAYATGDKWASCPHCAKPFGLGGLAKKPKRQKKKVLVQAVVDPSTGDFFEVRGEIPATVTAPRSGHTFSPKDGPVAGGKFTCQACGRKQDIVEAARVYGKPLPFRYYGFYAYTAAAERDAGAAADLGLPTNNYKWFAPAREADLARIEDAREKLEECSATLPLPTQEIYDGYNTNRLVIHQYKRWSDLYGPRQLLALGKLLKAIAEEREPTLRDALLAAFQNTVNYQSNLCRYNSAGNKIEGVTSSHDYRNPTTVAENPTFGANEGIGRGTFINYVGTLREGLKYLSRPDLLANSGSVEVDDVRADSWRPALHLLSATRAEPIPDRSIDLVISDPPYAGSVQYAEMSDWGYVWLQKVLGSSYPNEFGAEITLKSQEIIEDGNTKDPNFFFEQLTDAWRECHRVLVDDGLLVFTFHHREGDRWTGLLRSLFDAGFYLVAAYPTHSEALNSIVIQATKGITYDIIHVCRKRLAEPEPIPWSKLRRQVTREARDQLREIEQGKDVLPGPDIQMILLGKALKLFSQHYGKVLNAEGESMGLDEAMQRILVLVREVRGEDLPLPSALLDIDGLSQVALLHVVGKGPWARDDLHKELRGYGQSLSSLEAAGLVRPLESKQGRLEAVPAVERGQAGLSSSRHSPLIDKLHLLLAQVNVGRSIESHMKLWRGLWEVVAEGLQWLGKVDPQSRELAALTHRQVEALGTDPGPLAMTEQLGLFGSNDA